MAASCPRQRSFRYKSLDDTSRNIRLLRILPNKSDQAISCTLEQATLDQPYTCLSYCWGPDEDHRAILVDDETLLVRPNLFAFLSLAKKYSFDQPIWIDAICINQADTEEKSKQVQMMGNIYSEAIRTFVWLGLSKSDCRYISAISDFANSPAEDWELQVWKAAFRHDYRSIRSNAWQQIIDDIEQGDSSVWARARLIPALNDGFSSNPLDFVAYPIKMDLWSSLLRFWRRQLNMDELLHRLASSEYWIRTWIIQELVLSQNAVFFCDIHSASVKSLLPLIVNLVYTIEDESQRSMKLPEKDQMLWNPRYAMYEIAHHLAGTAPLNSPKTNFAKIAHLTAGRLCTDNRDRIFAVVSLVANGDKFVIDYEQSLDEVLVNVLRFHIANHATESIYHTVLPALFGTTVRILGLQAPAPTSLSPLQTLLDDIKVFDGAKNRFFWALPPDRTEMESFFSPDYDCSLCIGIEICGHQAILEFWYCSKEPGHRPARLFWWAFVDGRWTCEHADNTVEES